MRIVRQVVALGAVVVIGGSPFGAWADEPVSDPAAATPPIVAGADGGSGTFYVPPTEIVPPLVVTLSADGGLPSGAPGTLTIHAVDSLGNPTGGFATVIVRFPLAPDNSAYWTDLVLLAPIYEDGYGTVTITIPSAVPSGTPISIEAHAILPPHVAMGELKLNVG
ncbi:MAG: hypothetical protein KatS3mg060_0935 [Dehalococcoidia bacterium]|nr:MAG: hypothetical protein KatS3mg060_0935 [Dehalococcoidia bacterium]